MIVEERVQARAIAENVARAEDTQSPAVLADAGAALTEVVEVWVGGAKDAGDEVGGRLELGCVGVRLVVGGFGLDETHEDVLGLGEFVLVEGVVLNSSTPSREKQLANFSV